jgi:site-specific DNA-adenine methylase
MQSKPRAPLFRASEVRSETVALRYPGAKTRAIPELMRVLKAAGFDPETRTVGQPPDGFVLADLMLGSGALTRCLLENATLAPLSPKFTIQTHVGEIAPVTYWFWAVSKAISLSGAPLGDSAAKVDAALTELIRDYADLAGLIGDKLAYYALRNVINSRRGSFVSLPAHPEYLASLYLLNQTAFNGIVRHNAAGDFNVPPGSRSKGIQIPEVSAWEAHLALAGNLEIYRAGAWTPSTVLQGAVKSASTWGMEVLALLDPPYLGGFTGYTPLKWNAKTLADTLIELTERSHFPGIPHGSLLVVFEHTGGEAQQIIERAGGVLAGEWNRPNTVSSAAKTRGAARSEGIWTIPLGPKK